MVGRGQIFTHSWSAYLFSSSVHGCWGMLGNIEVGGVKVLAENGNVVHSL